MNLESVGFKPSDPIEELRLTYKAVLQLREVLKIQRSAFDKRRMRELDTQIANAWLISGELERRLKDAGQKLTEDPADPAP